MVQGNLCDGGVSRRLNGEAMMVTRSREIHHVDRIGYRPDILEQSLAMIGVSPVPVSVNGPPIEEYEHPPSDLSRVPSQRPHVIGTL